MGTKRKNMEDEMSRFEAEISASASTSVQSSGGSKMFIPAQVSRPVIQSNTYNQVQQKLSSQQPPPPPPVSINTVPPPPIPPSFIPTFVPSSMVDSGPMKSYTSIDSTPVVLSSAPKLYINRPTTGIQPFVQTPHIDINAVQFDVTQKLKKLKQEKSGPNPIAEEAIRAARASSALQSFQVKETKKKDKKTVRIAGGTVWEDSSLADWPDDDFRIFCGDLGNDVNDEVITRTFNKYPSFQRAKVIRDKRTGKSKGFGFVSFREPQDFIRAMKEMDGRYVGSRPIKLRKSTWKQRSIEIVKKKEKEKQALLQMFNTS